mmetsp:Transcript_925/g.3264  ORF Transcript_925/g.3264 Transcript_925/m.3264 type:complete len:225 (+) Transcript_925:975-1649(+)
MRLPGKVPLLRKGFLKGTIAVPGDPNVKSPVNSPAPGACLGGGAWLAFSGTPSGPGPRPTSSAAARFADKRKKLSIRSFACSPPSARTADTAVLIWRLRDAVRFCVGTDAACAAEGPPLSSAWCSVELPPTRSPLCCRAFSAQVDSESTHSSSNPRTAASMGAAWACEQHGSATPTTRHTNRHPRVRTACRRHAPIRRARRCDRGGWWAMRHGGSIGLDWGKWA